MDNSTLVSCEEFSCPLGKVLRVDQDLVGKGQKGEEAVIVYLICSIFFFLFFLFFNQKHGTKKRMEFFR